MGFSLRQSLMAAAALTLALPALACAPAEVKEGEKLYVRSCASCHGNGALGTQSGPALHLEGRKGAVDRVKHHQRQAAPSPHPALSDEEASQIAEYLMYLHSEASGHRH